MRPWWMSKSRRSVGLLALAVCALGVTSASAIDFGQFDTFPAGNAQGWSEGAPSPNQPTVISSGGPSGASDSYLSNSSSGGFGPGSRQVMFNTSQWAGDYTVAGVTRLQMKLANVGPTAMSVRLTFTGSSGTQYSSTDAFALPVGSGWMDATFLLSDTSMTSLSGTDTLAQVLSSVTQLRLLSAGMPGFMGDAIVATLGVDAIRAARLPGDATFDDAVNFDDLVKLAQNYGRTDDVPWTDGDFTFNGAVDFDDLVILAQNYNASGSLTGANGVGGAAFSGDWALAQSLVPEPVIAIVSAGGLSAAGCRRRRARPRR